MERRPARLEHGDSPLRCDARLQAIYLTGPHRPDAPIVNRLKPGDRIAATTLESDAMSKALKKRGFTFVGSTICYAFMQATGMVNDHVVGCVARRL